MKQQESKETLLEKPAALATIGEIWSVGQELGLVKKKAEEIPKDDYPGIPTLVTGIKGLAKVLGISPSTIVRLKASGEIDDCIFQSGKTVIKVLGISPSTIVRLKASGEIDDCIFQSGKTVIFDAHKVLDKLRLSNRTNKYHFNKNSYGAQRRKTKI